MLEAVWDPVQGKVVYKDVSSSGTTSTDAVAVAVREEENTYGVAPSITAPPTGNSDSRDPQKPTVSEQSSSTTTGVSAVALDRSTHRLPPPPLANADHFSWRSSSSVANNEACTTTEPTTSQRRRRSRTTTRKSQGIDPRQFHTSSAASDATENNKDETTSNNNANNNTNKNSTWQSVRREIQSRVIAAHTREQRRHTAAQRHAYHQCTLPNQAFPLQDRAVVAFVARRREWGVVEEDEEAATFRNKKKAEAFTTKPTAIHESNNPNKDHSENRNITLQTDGEESSLVPLLSSSFSSISIASDDNFPESKRSQRDRLHSPAQSQSLEQFKLELKRQQQPPCSHPQQDVDDCYYCKNNNNNYSSSSSSALYSMEPRIFGMERSGSGRRQYVVAHAGRFWDAYWRQEQPRHAYELIRPHTPCRLYLDLEATVRDHPCLADARHGTALQERLLTELWEQLAKEWQLQYGTLSQPFVTRSDSISANHHHDKQQRQQDHRAEYSTRYQWEPLQRHHIVDLDSSTDQKFSRHWIVHLPVAARSSNPHQRQEQTQQQQQYWEALFPDATAVGDFVRQWIGRLAEEQATGFLAQSSPTLQKHFFFTPSSVAQPASELSSQSSLAGKSTTATETDKVCPPPRIQCIVDMGVYTRNRLFRLMGSCKFGKSVSAALRIADSNEFPFPATFGNHCFYAPAMPTVSNSNVDASLADTATEKRRSRREDDDVEIEVKRQIAKTDWSLHAEAMAVTLVVPLNSAKRNHPILRRVQAECVKKASFGRSVSSSLSKVRPVLGFGQTPYPMVDDFVVQSLASRGDVQGSIRSWSIDSDPETKQTRLISYQLSRNRWCECVGRQHKSNNIAWHVDVLLSHCYQTCFDPECRALNFRGQPVPLPCHVKESLQEALWEEELGRLDLSNFVAPSVCVDDDAISTGATSVAPMVQIYNDVSFSNSDDDASFDKALASLSLDAASAASAPGAEPTNNRVPLLPVDPERKLNCSSSISQSIPEKIMTALSHDTHENDISSDSEPDDLALALAKLR